MDLWTSLKPRKTNIRSGEGSVSFQTHFPGASHRSWENLSYLASFGFSGLIFGAMELAFNLLELEGMGFEIERAEQGEMGC